MAFRDPFRRPWLRTVTIAGMSIAIGTIVIGWPHWTEWSEQSCQPCGNRRTIVQHFQWWRHAGTSIRERNEFSFPAGHVHDWWQYGFGKNSPTGRHAAAASARYRDGRMQWQPPGEAQTIERQSD